MSSRTLRLARSLAVFPGRAANRVAVRPFPLTEEMKQIIQESTDALREVVKGKVEGTLKEDQFVLWYGEGLSVHNHTVDLSVRLIFRENEELFSGYFDVSHGKYAFIRLVCSNRMADTAYFFPDEFYKHFQMVLHHELVHLMDVKSWVPEITRKLPEYRNPVDEEGYKDYAAHPEEKSAFEGMFYYYFRDAASRGVELSKAIGSFLKEKIGKNYRNTIRKSGGKDWKNYLTRLYKSAEQAYEDVMKEH